jgi:hypothetical protein
VIVASVSSCLPREQGILIYQFGRCSRRYSPRYAGGNDSRHVATASVNPSIGNTTVLSDNSGAGTGPAFDILRGITVGPNGDIYATDVGDDEIYG